MTAQARSCEALLAGGLAAAEKAPLTESYRPEPIATR
jgi:hypothetical protein